MKALGINEDVYIFMYLFTCSVARLKKEVSCCSSSPLKSEVTLNYSAWKLMPSPAR